MYTRKRMIFYSVLCILFVVFLQNSFAQVQNWRIIGLRYLNAGEPEKAIPFFRLAISADGSQGKYREELAYALQESGQYDEALTEYTAALALPGASVADIKYNMALVFAATQDYNSAYQYISEVISLVPDLSSAYINRANFAVQKKDYKKAIADYTHYLQQEPTSTQRPEIEKMIAILSKLKPFPVDSLEKEEYNRKKQLEEELNKQRKRLITSEPYNQFLGTE